MHHQPSVAKDLDQILDEVLTDEIENADFLTFSSQFTRVRNFTFGVGLCRLLYAQICQLTGGCVLPKTFWFKIENARISFEQYVQTRK
jgi:hypothetical protein